MRTRVFFSSNIVTTFPQHSTLQLQSSPVVYSPTIISTSTSNSANVSEQSHTNQIQQTPPF
jgi:hypothetical protein